MALKFPSTEQHLALAKRLRENARSLSEPERTDAIKQSNSALVCAAFSARERGGLTLSGFDSEAISPDWTTIDEQVARLTREQTHYGNHQETLPLQITHEGSSISTNEWDRESVRGALDDLFTNARQFNTSKAYLELIQFVGRFHFYSPFNSMLIYIQMPGARFVAATKRWLKEFRRVVRAGARPIVILQPKGPVLFVFDVADTEPLPGARPLPRMVTNPFEVRRGRVGKELEVTIENAKRDGIRIRKQAQGSQSAGSIEATRPGNTLELHTGAGGAHFVPLRYEMLLNSNLSLEAQSATLVHELGHLYCGHLGTPDQRWWLDRRGLSLSVCEFEAESICYLVCTRLGIDNASEEYLANYVRHYEATPPISLDCVMKASWQIEQMGRKRLPIRQGLAQKEATVGGEVARGWAC